MVNYVSLEMAIGGRCTFWEMSTWKKTITRVANFNDNVNDDGNDEGISWVFMRTQKSKYRYRTPSLAMNYDRALGSVGGPVLSSYLKEIANKKIVNHYEESDVWCVILEY